MRRELWIDADDTLWENNVFFERVFSEFVAFLDHSAMSPAEVRAELDRIEHVNNRVRGYGAANFAHNLTVCFQRISERPVTAADLDLLAGYAVRLANHPIELIDGVEPTLAYLSQRHRLTLCTKGDAEEQRAKIERSGLGPHFHNVRIVREKDAECYRSLLAERGAPPEACFMVGNSPKSDINPALEAGINAVYIPHPHTWHLEHTDIPESHDRLLVLEKFAELRDHF